MAAILAESLMGIFLIIMGFIVGRNPNTLNLFSAEDRKKTDMQAVGRMTRKWSVGLGVCEIISVCLFHLFEVGDIRILFYLLLVIVGVIIMSTKSLSSKYKL